MIAYRATLDVPRELAWFADALARDRGISWAAAYQYLDEVIAVLADQAPSLRQALERAKDEGLSHAILDGKIIATDRCKEKTGGTKYEVIDLWYSGKASASPCSWRQHPGCARARWVPAVGLRGGAGLSARPYRRPPPRPARAVLGAAADLPTLADPG